MSGGRRRRIAHPPRCTARPCRHHGGNKPLGLDVQTPLPSGIRAGDRVDVWASLPDGQNGYGEPRRLLTAAEISELSVTESVIAGAAATRLLVLVEDQDLPALLSALKERGLSDAQIRGIAGENLLRYYDRIDPR